MDSTNEMQGKVVKKKGASGAYVLNVEGEQMLTPEQRESKIRRASTLRSFSKSSSVVPHTDESELSEIAQREKLGSARFLYTGEHMMFDDSETVRHDSDLSTLRSEDSSDLGRRESMDSKGRRFSTMSTDTLGQRKSVDLSVSGISMDHGNKERRSVDSDISVLNRVKEIELVRSLSDPEFRGTSQIPGGDDSDEDSDSGNNVKESKHLIRTRISEAHAVSDEMKKKGLPLYQLPSMHRDRTSVDTTYRETELEELVSKQQERSSEYLQEVYRKGLKTVDVRRRRCRFPFHLNELEVVMIVNVLEDVLCQLPIVGCPSVDEFQGKDIVFYRTIEER